MSKPDDIAARLDRMAKIDATTGHRNGNGRHTAPEVPADVDELLREHAARGPAVTGRGTLHLTDYGNAERLVRRHGRDLHYCPVWGKWLVYDGRRWQVDDTGEIIRRAKETVRNIYTEAAAVQVSGDFLADDGDAKNIRGAIAEWAKKSEAAERIGKMVELAKSEPGIPVTPDLLDADPWLLNCLNGTIDLRTAELRPHYRDDLLTKLCPVAYDPAAECPTLEAFLIEVMARNQQLVDYLQRVSGFCLTGIPADRVMWFLYGKGRNGKSTFLSLLQDMLGAYAAKTPAETLLVKPHGDGIPNDLADLHGTRLVTSAELTEARRLNEARIKDLTGREVIKARFLHREFFQFMPRFKLFMYGNHRPVIRGTDEGIWDRVKLIPFTVRIENPDEHLPEKLRAELPGVLAWAVRGCLDWQHEGLKHPPEVETATKEYREEQDVLSDFLTECCITEGDSLQVTNPDLWTAYEEWCRANGEKHPVSRKVFKQQLEEHGFIYDRGEFARFWKGLTLKPRPKPAPDDSQVPPER